MHPVRPAFVAHRAANPPLAIGRADTSPRVQARWAEEFAMTDKTPDPSGATAPGSLPAGIRLCRWLHLGLPEARFYLLMTRPREGARFAVFTRRAYRSEGFAA